MANMDDNRIPNLAALRKAEKLVVSSVEAAASAFQALSAIDASAAPKATPHAERFVRDLSEAQRLVRQCITSLSSDLPFENATLNHLINADLAVQRTAHVHRSLVRTKRRLNEASSPNQSQPQPIDRAITEELLDSSGMTPPADMLA